MSSYRICAFVRFATQTLPKRHFQKTLSNHVQNFAADAKPREISTLKLAIFGAGIGAAIGTAGSLYTAIFNASPQDHMIHQQKSPTVLQNLPNVTISKKVVNPKDNTGLDLVLFQFQTCPFCCKLRACLDFLGLSYSVVEVDAVLRQDLKWSEYKKVPMLLGKRRDGKYVQLTESSTIVSILATFLNDTSQDIGDIAKLYPTISFFDDAGRKKEDVMNKYFLMYQDRIPSNLSKEQMDEERKWRSWADSHLVHLISPNVYRTYSEAFQTFEWFSDAGEWDVYFPRWEQKMMVYVGATAMWMIAKRLKKRHQLSDDVRGHIYDALDKWTGTLEKKETKFMGGSKPNLADLSVFGILSSMEGCQAFVDCLDNTKIGGWFYAVKEAVSKNRGYTVQMRNIVPFIEENVP